MRIQLEKRNKKETRSSWQNVFEKKNVPWPLRIEISYLSSSMHRISRACGRSKFRLYSGLPLSPAKPGKMSAFRLRLVNGPFRPILVTFLGLGCFWPHFLTTPETGAGLVAMLDILWLSPVRLLSFFLPLHCLKRRLLLLLVFSWPAKRWAGFSRDPNRLSRRGRLAEPSRKSRSRPQALTLWEIKTPY